MKQRNQNKYAFYIACLCIAIVKILLQEDNDQYFYVNGLYEGYILVVYPNDIELQNSNQTDRSFYVDTSGFVLSNVTHSNKGWSKYNVQMSFYDENDGLSKQVKIPFGDKLALCDSCTNENLDFTGFNFFWLKGSRFVKHETLDSVIHSYDLYLIVKGETVKKNSQGNIYRLSHQLGDYFSAYNSNIPLYSNQKAHEKLKLMIREANQNLLDYYSPPASMTPIAIGMQLVR